MPRLKAWLPPKAKPCQFCRWARRDATIDRWKGGTCQTFGITRRHCLTHCSYVTRPQKLCAAAKERRGF